MFSLPSWTSVCSCLGLPHPSCLEMILFDRKDRNKMEREKRWPRIIAYYCSARLFSGMKECGTKSSLTGNSILRKQICATLLLLWLVTLKSPFMLFLLLTTDFPGGSAGKESAYNVGDLCLIPGLGRCPGEGKGYQLQYSGLENPTDTGGCWATVHGVTKNRTPLGNRDALLILIIWCVI